MKLNKILTLALSLGFASFAFAQNEGATKEKLLKPLGEEWPTYNGDYTGKRYSSLTQINKTTVKNLSLAWLSQMKSGPETESAMPGVAKHAYVSGGEGDGTVNMRAGQLKGSQLFVDGVLYVTMPDNAWAVDARSGQILWHYFWKTKGGTHIANRGFGMWHNYLYLETPDDYLVSLDAKTGKERWHKQFADYTLGYFATPAPMIIGNHVLVGMGNDIDSPGFLQSFDPETGDLQWKMYTVPMEKGDPGADSWASLDAARHGGAQTWMDGAYDPETNLYMFSTGNPTPAYTSGTRGDKDNLFTCALIAINVETGKMAWYYQTSPHDMHDYDSAQTPVMIDGMFKGKKRKMVATSARNGYYFLLDRVTGEHLLTSKYGETTDWAKGLAPHGEPQHDPAKDATIAGSLASPNSSGTINWQPVAFSPKTGYLYTYETNSFSIVYLTDPDPRGSMGLGGKEETQVGNYANYLSAIDYATGKAKWRRPYYGNSFGGGGILATAGGLVFTGDSSDSFVAYDEVDGRPLWNSRIGQVSSAPQTFLLDGHQYVIAGVGDTLFSFILN